MTTFQAPGTTLEADVHPAATPLVVLFERDDAIAVPLLSQLRIAGYDVRAARTPVELFDITSKHLVALVLIDLGNATAGRREFWVALDAQRRGRPTQAMTFRYTPPNSLFDTDFEPTARAIADVEVHGTHEFQLIIEGVRQRIPLNGVNAAATGQAAISAPGIAGMAGMAGAAPQALQPGVIPPIGAALGVPSPFMFQQPQQAMIAGLDQFSPYATPAAQPDPNTVFQNGFPALQSAIQAQQLYQQQGVFEVPGIPVGFGGQAPAVGMPALSKTNISSPFAHPADSNPFAVEESPFAQPYSSNPFASEAEPVAAATSSSTPPQATTIHTFDFRAASNPPMNTINPMNTLEERAARLSEAYAAEFGLGGSMSSAPSIASSPGMQGGRAWVADAWDAGGFFGASGESSGVTDAYTQRYSSVQGGEPVFSDAWTPPGEDPADSWGATSSTPSRAPLNEAQKQMAFTQTEIAPAIALNNLTGIGRQQDTDTSFLRTSPVPTPDHLSAAHRSTPTEKALGSVLVEGALLSEQKLEALKGVQEMLESVNMNFKLGELALLFKFLSPDQLLAALLVSRGLVSPQQIAGLGRAKQDLSTSGMDYSLADLLTMFHILPEEQVRQIRNEIAV